VEGAGEDGRGFGVKKRRRVGGEGDKMICTFLLFEKKLVEKNNSENLFFLSDSAAPFPSDDAEREKKRTSRSNVRK
jgi:hypothetical protein